MITIINPTIKDFKIIYKHWRGLNFFHIGVDYEEFKPETYKGVYITAGNLTIIYKLEDFYQDHDYAVALVKSVGAPYDNTSSSFGDYIMDAGIECPFGYSLIPPMDGAL